jgi:hypothetical protein
MFHFGNLSPIIIRIGPSNKNPKLDKNIVALIGLNGINKFKKAKNTIIRITKPKANEAIAFPLRPGFGC